MPGPDHTAHTARRADRPRRAGLWAGRAVAAKRRTIALRRTLDRVIAARLCEDDAGRDVIDGLAETVSAMALVLRDRDAEVAALRQALLGRACGRA
jgi:CHASE3 domain sensor protein